MFSSLALGGAHRCRLLGTFLLIFISSYTFTAVHSLPLSVPPSNVSTLFTSTPSAVDENVANATDSPIVATTLPNITVAPQLSTSLPPHIGWSYPKIVGHQTVNGSTSLSVSVVVPESVPDKDISTRDDLADYDADSGPFLLMSSVKSIRYWSPQCALHSSNELLAHRPLNSNLRNGFSGMSVRQNPAGHGTELIWFDVEKYEFHLARLAVRVNSTNCDKPLTFSYNTTLNYSSNPRASDYARHEEKMVKIASSANHLMIANFLLDRIDIYRLNESNSDMEYVESINAVRPSDIVFQRNHLIWLENGFRICRFKEFFNELRPKVPECHETRKEIIQAFTVSKNRQILYSTKVRGHQHTNIYRLDWNSFESELIGSIELPEIVSMSSMDSNVIFFSENDGQVYRLNISNGFHDLHAVVIEASTIFDITFMSSDFEGQLEKSYLDDHYREVILVAYNPEKWIFFLSASIVAIIIVCLMLFFRKPAVRQRFTTIQAKLPNARGLLRNFRPYAQMTRQARATSMSNALIDEDDSDSVNNYRQNISSHRPIAANDIEDLLGGGNATQSTARCIACRDPGICQDKGLCMATYRTQQQ